MAKTSKIILSRRINEAAHILLEVHLAFRNSLVVIPLIQFLNWMCVVLGVAETIFVMWCRHRPLSNTERLTETFSLRYPNCLCFILKIGYNKGTKTWSQEKLWLESFPDLLEGKAVDSRIGDLMKYREVGFTVIQFSFNGCPKGKRHFPVIVSW